MMNELRTKNSLSLVTFAKLSHSFSFKRSLVSFNLCAVSIRAKQPIKILTAYPVDWSTFLRMTLHLGHCSPSIFRQTTLPTQPSCNLGPMSPTPFYSESATQQFFGSLPCLLNVCANLWLTSPTLVYSWQCSLPIFRQPTLPNCIMRIFRANQPSSSV